MNKQEYITRQLERTRGKRYENYVVTRIWHKLDDLNVKIVTQQYVARQQGRALSDLYFPQLGWHVEVNEGHHYDASGERVESDVQRARDVVNATQHEFVDIKVWNESLDRINEQVDYFVARLKARIAAARLAGRFVDWDIDAEFDPNTYIKRGYIDVADSVAFRRIADACNCFGRRYGGMQHGFVQHGVEADCWLWFPKLYSNEGWQNSTSVDESEIYEVPVFPATLKGTTVRNQSEYLAWFLTNPGRSKRRIVFAHARDALGVTLYRFKGVYQFNEEQSRASDKHVVYRRLETNVKTYPQPADVVLAPASDRG